MAVVCRIMLPFFSLSLALSLLVPGQVRAALEQSFSEFDVVEFVGKGTTPSQLQMFATASVVVAPHGAGLANTIVSPLHTPVLEIAPLM